MYDLDILSFLLEKKKFNQIQIFRAWAVEINVTQKSA